MGTFTGWVGRPAQRRLYTEYTFLGISLNNQNTHFKFRGRTNSSFLEFSLRF